MTKLNKKIILFDADDTLIDLQKCTEYALKYLFKQIGIKYRNEFAYSFNTLDKTLWEGKVIPKDEIPTERFKIFFSINNIDYNDYVKANELFKTRLSGAIKPIPESTEVLKYLYTSGYVICVVSNGLVSLQFPRINNTPFGKYIKRILVSEEIGKDKPDPKIFIHILDEMGFDVNDAVMIGDSLEKDIMGAKKSGIYSIWYNRKNKINNTGITPDLTIENLKELYKIL